MHMQMYNWQYRIVEYERGPNVGYNSEIKAEPVCQCTYHMGNQLQNVNFST